MNRFIIVSLIFALGGATAASLLAPRLLSWYASPPVPIGVSCDPAIQWAMDKLIFTQLTGWVAGLVLGLVVVYWLRGGKRPMKEVSTNQ